jgi:hypothetical protein
MPAIGKMVGTTSTANTGGTYTKIELPFPQEKWGGEVVLDTLLVEATCTTGGATLSYMISEDTNGDKQVAYATTRSPGPSASLITGMSANKTCFSIQIATLGVPFLPRVDSPATSMWLWVLPSANMTSLTATLLYRVMD